MATPNLRMVSPSNEPSRQPEREWPVLRFPADAERIALSGRDPIALADDVLRSLDRLSITLDQLRAELDELDDDWPRPAA